jgi:hypothetical protein
MVLLGYFHFADHGRRRKDVIETLGMPDYSMAENNLGWGSSQDSKAGETILDAQVAGHRKLLLGVREQAARQDTAEVGLVDTSGPSAAAGRALVAADRALVAAGMAPVAVDPNVRPNWFLGQ